MGSAAAMLTAVLWVPAMQTVTYDRNASPLSDNETKTEEVSVNDDREEVTHQPLPTAVKAIYMTSCVAGTPTFRQRLVDLIKETEINSVIIDIKDFSGTISFPPESDAWRPAWGVATCGATDMKEFIKEISMDI